MSKVRVEGFSISGDGYGAGARQSLQNPLGEGGEELHQWLIPTRTFKQASGKPGGTTGQDDEVAARGMTNIGAWIMGRNMFAPSRGPWPDDTWKGWWGKNPPYHTPVFVLTHHARAAIPMEGGTVFHFVTDGIHEALERARQAAGVKDIRVLGGVSVVRQYLQAGLIDEMHLAISPIVLGSGEHLLSGIDLPRLGYRLAEHVMTPDAMHLRFAKAT
jgi:dihydrofolate reductase